MQQPTAHFPLPLQGKPERLHLYRWIAAEEEYVFGKFDQNAQRDDHDEEMRSQHVGPESFWIRQIMQYYDRANLFFAQAAQTDDKEAKRALESRGQQALAKAMMTAKGCVESSIRVFGPMPAPGVASGEISEWSES